MNLEIHKPELVQRVCNQIQSGEFHDLDELLTKALDALEAEKSSQTRIQGDGSGAALLAVLQNSPYPEIDLAPARDRVPVQVRDIVL